MSEETRPITLHKLEIRKNFIVTTNSLAMAFIAILVASFFAPPAMIVEFIPIYFILVCRIASGCAAVIAFMFYVIATTRLILDGERKSLYLISFVLFVLFAIAFGDIGFLM